MPVVSIKRFGLKVRLCSISVVLREEEHFVLIKTTYVMSRPDSVSIKLKAKEIKKIDVISFLL